MLGGSSAERVDDAASPSSIPGAPPVTTVLYTLCSPHSGSTILGLGLSSHPDIFFAGELFDLPRPGWVPGRPCACGRPAGECPMWGAVQRDVTSFDSLETLARDQRWFNRWRSVPRLVLARWRPSPAERERAERLRRLAESIAARSGRRIIIDTSKMPSRALAYSLVQSETFRVRFVHLVRDTGPEIASRMSSSARHSDRGVPPRNARLRFAIRWILANLAFVVLFAGRRENYLRLRYEDLLRDPAGGIGAIGALLGLDLGEVGERAGAGFRFPVGHIITANRIMFLGAVAFRRLPAHGGNRLVLALRWLRGRAGRDGGASRKGE